MTRIRVFKNEETLKDMLNLRRKGYTYDQLAEIYNVDRTSIQHWCNIYGLNGQVVQVIRQFYRDNNFEPRMRITVITEHEPESIWQDDLIEGRVNKGKSYADYLKEAKQRESIV